jgi:hypothetical protein
MLDGHAEHDGNVQHRNFKNALWEEMAVEGRTGKAMSPWLGYLEGGENGTRTDS